MKTLSRSFSGGEISPELHARLDLTKYQTGLALCRNFVVLPHGPVQNRAGFEYVVETKDSTKRSVLIPFQYNDEQTYALEFGEGYIRFHTGGGTLREDGQQPQAIAKTSPAVVTLAAHGYVTGDWVFAYDIAGMTQLNGRWFKVGAVTTNTFQLLALDGSPLDSTAYGTYTPGSGFFAKVYEIATDYVEADLFDLYYVQSADVLTITHQNYPQAELRRYGAVNWSIDNIVFDTALPPPANVAVTAYTGGTPAPTPGTVEYVVQSIVSGGRKSKYSPAARVDIDFTLPGASVTLTWTPRPFYDPVEIGYRIGRRDAGVVYEIGNVAGTVLTFVDTNLPAGPPMSEPSGWVGLATLGPLTLTAVDTSSAEGASPTASTYVVTALGDGLLEESFASGSAAVANDLALSGAYNVLSWEIASNASSAAVRYNVYKQDNGLYGFIGQTAELTFRDDNITPDLSRTPPEGVSPFTEDGDHPRAVTYYQGRRWFGGTANKPQNLWATRSSTESNMTYSVPNRDSDSINVRIAARKAQVIRHIVPLDELLLLTSGGEWRVLAQNSDAITPSGISFKPQGHTGASNVQPVITSESVLYAQARGGHVREMLYSFDRQGYETNDISIMAPALFDGFEIVQMAYSQAPHPVIWCVRDDGMLLGLTYVPEHQIAAWHQHDTDGKFESIAAIAEDKVDTPYAIVQRVIDGRSVRYIERQRPRQFATLADSFLVDCGGTYDGAPTSTISNLHFLEGKTVSILADGAVHPQRVVTNGAITLEVEASKVQIGLPITADMQTLPMALEIQAWGQAVRKNVSKVYLRVGSSSGVFVGPSLDQLTEVKQRTDEVYGAPPRLKSGLIDALTKGQWSEDASIFVRQTDPLPLTVLALVPDVAVGG